MQISQGKIKTEEAIAIANLVLPQVSTLIPQTAVASVPAHFMNVVEMKNTMVASGVCENLKDENDINRLLQAKSSFKEVDVFKKAGIPRSATDHIYNIIKQSLPSQPIDLSHTECTSLWNGLKSISLKIMMAQWKSHMQGFHGMDLDIARMVAKERLAQIKRPKPLIDLLTRTVVEKSKPDLVLDTAVDFLDKLAKQLSQSKDKRGPMGLETLDAELKKLEDKDNPKSPPANQTP